ncbi:MAG: hypothetical protein DRN17_01245 [Thermoplasmata archaeon]|nr:MAG: hypothetical protein DRN17_01245 [Thermoplasmata archaeon]
MCHDILILCPKNHEFCTAGCIKIENQSTLKKSSSNAGAIANASSKYSGQFISLYGPSIFLPYITPFGFVHLVPLKFRQKAHWGIKPNEEIV